MESQPYCTYFLFINSGSGGGVGQKLIKQEAQKITFDICLNQSKQAQKQIIDIYFYNLRTSKDKGFKTLKSLLDKKFNIKVIICGGDGTVIWVISELTKYNIDTQATPLGIIPLGTGNDFSQYLGWGKLKTSLTQNSFASLKKLIRKWEKANVEYFDIWDIKAQIYQHGKFEKVEQAKNATIQGRTFQRSFCNYFSFGIDGKIGYSFDMHRTQSRLGNLAMYGIMGMVKALTKTKSMNELIHGMQIRPQLDSNYIQSQQKIEEPAESLKMSNYSNQQKSQKRQSGISKLQSARTSFIFKTKHSKQQTDVIELKRDYYNILALNINSFMGGVFDIWKKAKTAFKNQQEKKFTEVSSNDGKLQFVSFSSSVGMAAERTFGGFAKKITQGGGPFYFQFKQYDPKQKHRTYLQIDGQFIRFSHPKSVLIRKSIYGRNGKVKVLRNVIQK